MKNFKNMEFVIFDVETTGLSHQMGDRVVEVAALKVKGLEATAQFHSLVNPGREISSDAYLVNGITPEMLLGAPESKDVFPALLDFLADSVIVGHNIKFDLGFLTTEALLLGLTFLKEPKSLCTIQMARALLPDMGRYSLWMVAERLGIDLKQEHRALSDVYLTFGVFKRLLEIADRRDITDLNTLILLFGNDKQEKRKELNKKIATIEQAIQLKNTIEISYFSLEQNAMTFRRVTPQKIVKQQGYWKLLGFCHLREEDRSFRIDKILELNSYAAQSNKDF